MNQGIFTEFVEYKEPVLIEHEKIHSKCFTQVAMGWSLVMDDWTGLVSMLVQGLFRID